MGVSLWCLCSVLISMLYFKGLIYHVYLIYMSMSFMSSLINVKFLVFLMGPRWINLFLSQGHSSLHHRVALLPVQCNLTWVRKSVESMSGKQTNLRNKCSLHPWGFKIFCTVVLYSVIKLQKAKLKREFFLSSALVDSTRFLKPVWWMSVQWSCLFFLSTCVW